MSTQAKDKSGYSIGPIDRSVYRAFAKRNAHSPEIGPIKTCLDDKPDDAPLETEIRLFGLVGCHDLCAVACLQLFPSDVHEGHAVKLDSVIVHAGLRQRGLGGLLVARAFADVVADESLAVSRIYAHAVHPGTVRLLSGMAFSAPPPVGAPLSGIELDAEKRQQFTTEARKRIERQEGYLKLQCALCRKCDRRAAPWCIPDSEDS